MDLSFKKMVMIVKFPQPKIITFSYVVTLTLYHDLDKS